MDKQSPEKTPLSKEAEFNIQCHKLKINEANQHELLADQNSQTQNKIPFSQPKLPLHSSLHQITPTNANYTKAQRNYKNPSLESEDQQKPKLKIRKCWNINCESVGPFQTVKSVIHDHQQYQLCDACSHHYDLNHYCQYCEEIYNPDKISSTDEWYTCSKCNRMNHQKCSQNQRKRQTLLLTFSYECINCQTNRLASKKSKKNKLINQQYMRKHQKMLLDFLKRRKTFFQQKEKKNPNLLQRVNLKFPNAENVFRRQNFSLALTREQVENDLRRLREHSKLKEKIDL